MSFIKARGHGPGLHDAIIRRDISKVRIYLGSESMGMVNYRREGFFFPKASRAGSRDGTGFI